LFNMFGKFNTSRWCTGVYTVEVQHTCHHLDWRSKLANFQAFTASIYQVIILWSLTPCMFIVRPCKCLISWINILSLSNQVFCCCLYMHYRIEMVACWRAELRSLCCSLLLLKAENTDNLFALVTKFIFPSMQ
jgi:hypothetical protein